MSEPTLAEAIGGAIGGAVAGQAGLLLGRAAGRVLGALIPTPRDILTELLADSGADTARRMLGAGWLKLQPYERELVNHDLQSAFREAFKQALYDVGGPTCFPEQWKKPRLPVPPNVAYPLAELRERHQGLAESVCEGLRWIEHAVESGKLLPLEPAADDFASSVATYLQAPHTEALTPLFHDLLITPALHGMGTLTHALNEAGSQFRLGPHLREHLFDRTWLHFGERLKAETPAWRAFNRLLLENLHVRLQRIEHGQVAILERLQGLPEPADEVAVARLSSEVGAILRHTALSRDRMGLGFEMVLDRVAAQHGEQMAFLADMRDEMRLGLAQVEKRLRLLAAGKAEQATQVDVSDLGAAFMTLEALPLGARVQRGALPPGSRRRGLKPNPLFVGREAVLHELARLLKGEPIDAQGQVAAITGIGGVGKTQLAAEFAFRYGRYFAGGVFWLSFADAAGVPAEVAACGGPGVLNLRPDFAELSLEEQVALVRQVWEDPVPRLLIFDNCEEPGLLAQWQPTWGGARVLVTSRRGACMSPVKCVKRAEWFPSFW